MPGFRLAVFPGAEESALSAAVAAKAGLAKGNDVFFLTAEADEGPGEVVVPLSASLPDGIHLLLHHVAAAHGAPAPPGVEVGTPSASPVSPQLADAEVRGADGSGAGESQTEEPPNGVVGRWGWRPPRATPERPRIAPRRDHFGMFMACGGLARPTVDAR